MGTYIYRVTAKKIKCSDGVMANVAIFAYKPYGGWDGDKVNKKFHFKSGAVASDRLAATNKLTDRIVFAHDGVIDETHVYRNLPKCGTFHDEYIGNATSFPLIPGVTIPPGE